MSWSRRSILSALIASLPLGVGRKASAGMHERPTLRFRSFEDAVREAFAEGNSMGAASDVTNRTTIRRIEVGCSDLIRTGIQGCHNDRPFAGFSAGRLRIIRTSSAPGAEVQGVRLHVSTVDVLLTTDHRPDPSARPLNFASLPPAPSLVGPIGPPGGFQRQE